MSVEQLSSVLSCRPMPTTPADQSIGVNLEGFGVATPDCGVGRRGSWTGCEILL